MNDNGGPAECKAPRVPLKPKLVRQEIQDEDEEMPGGLKSISDNKMSKMNGHKAKSAQAPAKSEAVEESVTGELHQPTTSDAEVKNMNKVFTQAKRKRDTESNEGPPTKKLTYRKPRQDTLEAARYVSRTNALVLGGKAAKLAQSLDIKLPQICHAPGNLREHLKGLEAAGLRLPHAVPATIKTHVKALSGLCHAFESLQPWLSLKHGEEPRVDDFKWKVQGLNHPLHSHQILGSAIMITIEKDPDQGLGSGLLLDFMGFGKTVQTLACIVSNPARFKKRKHQRPNDGSSTTLVVVPKSAATQWVEEIQRHANPHLSVMLWTKESETTRNNTLQVDILVVTYNQVRTMRTKKDRNQFSSLLFDAHFHRVVLDEAHTIKSRTSDTFMACMGLQGTHRWALTGTPIPNGVHEIWPLLTFIRHPSVKDFPHFKKTYLTKKLGQTEYEELVKLLLDISIMRTRGHEFCGLPLVNLPQDHAVKESVKLSPEEKTILDSLNENIMNFILRKSGGKSNYFSLLERFTRHRQFSSSPLLLKGLVNGGLWTLEDVKKMRDEARNFGCKQTPIIDLFERWLLEPKSLHLALTGDSKADAAIAKTDKIICPLCSKRPTEPQLTGCSHLWCLKCVQKWMRMIFMASEPAECPKCNRLVGEWQPHDPETIGGQDGEGGRGDDYNGFQPTDEDTSGLFATLNNHPRQPIPLTSKLGATLNKILKWQAEAPMDKIIVFQRFIGSCRILGRFLQDRGIAFLYFNGQMSDDQRRHARVIFDNKPDVKVLLISTKTGSESLNLTAANRVIINDLWWNCSADEQAFGRVNRIGQHKETHCVLFLTEGTIDERMRHLQEKKKKQQSAISELEAGGGLTAKTLRKLLDDRIEKEKNGDSDGTDSEGSEQDDDGGHESEGLGDADDEDYED